MQDGGCGEVRIGIRTDERRQTRQADPEADARAEDEKQTGDEADDLGAPEARPSAIQFGIFESQGSSPITRMITTDLFFALCGACE